MARKFLEIRGVTYVPDSERDVPHIRSTACTSYRAGKRGSRVEPPINIRRWLTSEHSPVKHGNALDKIWKNITDTHAGGLGAVHGIRALDQSMSYPMQTHSMKRVLVGNVLLNYRMFLLQKDAKYAESLQKWLC